MLYIPNNEHNPRWNLAMEMYLLEEKALSEPCIFFYINSPSIIIGRNQNTVEEINEDYVAAHHLAVVRRMSGGGAVYHDQGNLNFSFILPTSEQFMDFKTATAPIVQALKNLGVKDVHLSGRNDLLIGTKKFSGLAMYRHKDRMVCHGTLLFNSDLAVVEQALTVHESKLKTKGIKSVRSRVTNILPHLPKEKQTMTTEDFREALLKELFHIQDVKEIPLYLFTDEDYAHIEKLVERYYDNWDWNYGASPDFNIHGEKKFACGLLETRLLVKEGKILEAYFYGDFFGTEDVQQLNQALKNCPYEREAVAEKLASFTLADFFGKDVTMSSLLDLIFEKNAIPLPNKK